MSSDLSKLVFVRAKLASAVQALAGPGICHEKIEIAYESIVGLDAKDFGDAQLGADFEVLRSDMRTAIDLHALGDTGALSEAVCGGFTRQVYELTLRANRT